MRRHLKGTRGSLVPTSAAQMALEVMLHVGGPHLLLMGVGQRRRRRSELLLPANVGKHCGPVSNVTTRMTVMSIVSLCIDENS